MENLNRIVTASDELDFGDLPSTDDIRFSDYLTWLDEHRGDKIFHVIVQQGFYRVSWKPENKPQKIPVDTPSPV